MKRKTLFWIMNVLLLAMPACSDDSHLTDDEENIPEIPAIPENSENLLDFTIEFDENDVTYGQMEETVITDPGNAGYDDFIENAVFSHTVRVTYNGTEAVVSNEIDGVEISRDGSHVVVRSSLPGIEYVMAGGTENGSFKIYSEDPFKLSLAGISIVNPVGAGINIQSSRHAFIVCETGTSNILTDGNSYVETDGEDMKGCLFSEGPVVFSGDYLNLRTSGGQNILTYQIPRDYSRMQLLFSGPGLTADGSYILSIGGTVSGGTSFYGFLSENSCSGGTDLENFTVNSMVTTLGNTSGWW